MFNFEDGEVILIDKPIDWTSFDTVNFIRALIKRFYKIPKLKVGHAGTLDPLATGLLILCTGKKTKQIEEYQAKIKTYTGTILLGQTTPTFDLESEPDQTFSTEGITAEQIEDARMKFIGDIKQYPPKYSAIKIKGKRAFDYARSDEEIELKARDIHIEDFKLNTERFPELDFEVTCSKGTYIRSLANDLGKELGNGACLKSLRRTRIGDFKVEDAWQLEDLKQHIIDTGDEFIAMRKAMQEAEQNKH
ncbi:MAG: tRNA pseudouridine(55) synthase TruB [Bacteroidales bacterium]|nr:tRNA pseudouridine(55) synthase TruB [Bacteroidales bacterium]